MLKDIDGSIINYAGLIEGFQIFENVVDVVVCDGFVGNIVLKACESLSKLIGSFLDEELRRNALRKTGALLSKGAFRSLKQRINPEQFGGAPLLGLTKNVIKALMDLRVVTTLVVQSKLLWIWFNTIYLIKYLRIFVKQTKSFVLNPF